MSGQRNDQQGDHRKNHIETSRWAKRVLCLFETETPEQAEQRREGRPQDQMKEQKALKGRASIGKNPGQKPGPDRQHRGYRRRRQIEIPGGDQSRVLLAVAYQIEQEADDKQRDGKM